MKEEQQRRITEDNKLNVHEELFQKVILYTAATAAVVHHCSTRLAPLLPLMHGCPPSPPAWLPSLPSGGEEAGGGSAGGGEGAQDRGEQTSFRGGTQEEAADSAQAGGCAERTTSYPSSYQGTGADDIHMYLWPTFHLPLLCLQQAIHGTLSQEMLEDAKMYMQEQMLRKAAQKSADKAMDAEQER